MERDISEVFDNNLSVFRRSEKSVVTIGRDPSNDIAVYGFGVSARHAELRFIDEGMSIHDCKSHSGVKVNGEEIQGESEITSGCRIDIGIVSLKVTFDSKECRVERTEFPSVQEHRQSASDKSFTIGRSKDNDIVLDHPLVSRYHCEIKRQKDKPLLKDLGSTNGTFVNGKPCKRCEIHENDMLHIGHFRFSIKNGRPVESDIDRNIHIQASDLTVQYGETRILDRVSLSVRPGEFSVVLGPSGSGKTTLARAIAGIIPRSGGGVYYNGLSMRRFRKVFHSHIGFVSQNILLRDNLKVSETLEEQAVLKLPTDSTPLERKAKIQNVLEELDIKDLYDKRISSLSGGQARRVHLAIELLSSPDVIFLDEPLAGLDSGLIDKFMKLFRELSRKGKTVVITTHTLERLEDADKVIFVNYGRVVYNGAPSEIYNSFGAKDIREIYDKCREEGKALTPLKQSMALDDEASEIVELNERTYRRVVDWLPDIKAAFLNFRILLLRYFRLLIRDKVNLSFLLIQTPVIALLLSFVFRPDSGYLPLSFYFCISVTCVWAGGMASVREITSERELVDRDYRAGLQPEVYFISRTVLMIILSAVQTMLFSLSLALIYENFPSSFKEYIVLFSANISGVLLGFLISVFSRNTAQALSLLPIVFIPQIFYSGIMLPFDEMSETGQLLSKLTVTRPVFSIFKQISVLDNEVLFGSDFTHLTVLGGVMFAITLILLRIRKIKI